MLRGTDLRVSTQEIPKDQDTIVPFILKKPHPHRMNDAWFPKRSRDPCIASIVLGPKHQIQIDPTVPKDLVPD